MHTPDQAASRITIAGFGDVGQSYAAALKNQGAALRIFHPAPRALALEAASRIGVAIETDAAAAYRDCDLVLNVAPGTQALSVARTAVQHLPEHAVFADLSSAAPDALRAAARLFPEGRYVDIAIMGAISIHGHHTPLLASGSGAARLKERLQRWGFAVEALPDSTPGDATALKLVRSILTKGMDAVMVESMLVAESLGLRKSLLAQMGDLDSSPLTELMEMFVRTHAPHAVRRLHEIEAIEATLRDLDVPLIVTAGVKKRFARSIALLGADARVPTEPADASLYDRVLPWMLAAERRGPPAEHDTTGV
jgi:3-hydroxyisobutyrate dehydrogenase-like beta-hydroxyacid dehydrogenase